LAIGVALGAIGLAEATSASPLEAPFENSWVVVGVILALVAAAWVVGTFVLALIATAKTERFRLLLGHALTNGDLVSDAGSASHH